MLPISEYEGRVPKCPICPIWNRRPLTPKLEVLIHVPVNVAEDPVLLLLAKGVDVSNLLELLWLEYADEDL